MFHKSTIEKPFLALSMQKFISGILQATLLIAIVVVSSSSNAQNNSQELTHESQIIEFLGTEKFQAIQVSNPSYLKFLDARCKGYLIMDYVEEKMQDFEVIKKIPRWNSSLEKLEAVSPEEFILDLESSDFNFLKYKFDFDKSNLTYYVIGETGKVLMIFSVDQINKIVNSAN